jgi:ABC-type Na+ efflux pump permease subunit
MSNSIILSSCFFGSIFLCSTSLKIINQSFLQDKKIPNKLIIINSLTFVMSGSIFVYSFILSDLFHFKSSRV